MTDDAQLPEVEADPAVQAAEAVEARAHAVVERVRADALSRAKHARDLAALAAAVAAEEAAAKDNGPSLSFPDTASAPPAAPAPEPVKAAEPEPEAPAPQAEPVEPTPAPVEPHQPEPEAAPEPQPAPPAQDPEPAPPPPEPRSARPPFATGRTRPGPRAWRNGGAVQLTDHEWARVRAPLTDAEAADGEAGGARLQALVTSYGADTTWSPARLA